MKPTLHSTLSLYTTTQCIGSNYDKHEAYTKRFKIALNTKTLDTEPCIFSLSLKKVIAKNYFTCVRKIDKLSESIYLVVSSSYPSDNSACYSYLIKRIS